ncbi:MAG: hypothetical protein WAQ25_00680 [Candidatus Saccharimonas sp.]
MLGKVLAVSTLVAFVLLSATLQSTSPSTIHPLGILFVFILLYVLALGVLTFFVYITLKFVNRLSRKPVRRNASIQFAYYMASVLALAPVMYIAIRSIGRAGWYDLVLIAIFEIIACFYVVKRY